MEKYNHKKIEKKWQKVWEDKKVAKIDKDNLNNKFYMLDMFPYPSGEGLHMGHTESYTASDVYARFKTMQGFNVLHSQGFDAFGLPAENYAIKTGISPAETTQKNIANYISQMKSLGLRYDFDEMINTSSPDYYKWTQWLFEKFFENNLVYKKTSKVNWCHSCQTVIANEQVIGGECERCGTQIVQKEVPGWFFKITEFADSLISDLDKVDWPESTKKNQRNWIGKSEGAKISFAVKGFKRKIEVFTTRPDTLFGATYMVLAPEHELLQVFKEKIENWTEVEVYLDKTQNKTEMDRIEAKEKTGVKLEGITAINPANQEEIPIFVADYVLGNYGTGAIMAVPAHDERDFQFAKKYALPIIPVVLPEEYVSAGGNLESYTDKWNDYYSNQGNLINSRQFDGLNSEEAKKKITEFVDGKLTTNYRLRDWSISRQRYWGCPIPIVYSPEGEAHLIPEEHLPWLLPTDVDFVPTGKSPLAKSKELRARVEKIFGSGWVPEFETMDTFVDSSWYFLRYPDAHNEQEFCSEARKKWLPVDLYIGGAEHTYMHLLFARFFVKAMNKIGLLGFDEPFLRLRHQGMVLDDKGKKMSKSKGNVINPEEMVKKFGADAVRTYMLFAAPLEDNVIWNEDNIVGIYRFLEKVWSLKEFFQESPSGVVKDLQKTIKKVGEDIETLKYNTAIAEMMKFVNVVKKSQISQKDYEVFLKLLAPFAPHIAEEIWEKLGHQASVHLEEWPQYDGALAQDDKYLIAVQVNGKVRAKIEINAMATEEKIKETALQNEKIKKWLGSQEPKKFIYVKAKLLNIVV